jgi:cytoskeletal protein RodZ
MASIGQKLRQERERLGIPVADIARETRISARYLEAIEAEDTRTLPQDFFYRSFVRQYAEYLGISADEITVSLRRDLPPAELPALPNPAPKPMTSIVAPPQPSEAPVEPAPVPWSRSIWSAGKANSTAAIFEEARTSKTWLAVAALLLIGSVSYLATRPNLVDSAAPAVTAQVQNVKSQPTIATPVANPPVTSTSTDIGTAVVQATNLGSGRLQIVISAREQTWIKLVADGKNIYMGLIEPGQSQAIENASNAELLTGNAGGIEVKQNGKSLPGLGSSGEVRTVVFDTENYQVRQPAPKPKAADPAPADGAKPAATSSTD